MSEKIRLFNSLTVLISAAMLLAEGAAAAPVRIGVDDAGAEYPLHKVSWGVALVKDLGIDTWVMHFFPSPVISQNLSHIREVDQFCEKSGLLWVANFENANWIREFSDETGYNWYNREDGRHFELPPETVRAALGAATRCDGVMYDEAEHMQNCANAIANGAKLWKPYIYAPSGNLEKASDAFSAAVGDVAALYRKDGVRLYTEHVFPVLCHGFAAGRFTASVKILKESWAPVHLACGMGAALQYGTEFWVTPDLWFLGNYPGHSAEEYRSALLLAYHFGADCIYTENLSYDSEKKGRGSLILAGKEGYSLTEYGRVLQWFAREYVPAHPRTHSFRDFQPRVAIIRQPDGCWGQGNSWLPDALYGNSDWPSNEKTEAWFRIFHLLTRGVVPADGLSWNGAGSYVNRPHGGFCPMDGVVVFDHKVDGARLAGVEAVFLTGLGVSSETLGAVEKAVLAGTVCFVQPHLAPGRVRDAVGKTGELADGAGRWVVADDFLSPIVRKNVGRFCAERGAIRGRFAGKTVSFSFTEEDPNRLILSE